MSDSASVYAYFHIYPCGGVLAAYVCTDIEVSVIAYMNCRCRGLHGCAYVDLCWWVHLALGGMSQGGGGLRMTRTHARLRPGGSFLQSESGQRNQGAAESIRIQLEFQELLPDLGEVAAGPLLLCWQKWQLPTQGIGSGRESRAGP